MDQSPEAVQRGIDEALAEIDELEAEVQELLGELVGRDVAARIAALGESDYRLMGVKLPKRSTPGASPGPSTGRPGTP